MANKKFQKVENLCITLSKTLCNKCEKFSSKLQAQNFSVQKSFIPHIFTFLITLLSTKNLICLSSIFSTIPHSLNTIIIN